MNAYNIQKCLMVGIILLFIGVAVAPSINFTVVKASQDDDLVEVTTQACGIQGFGNTTVKLTREQYNDLERYLVEFRARLNQTTTREKAVPIFKDAVVELNKYGLLPKGMSVAWAQVLVTGLYQNTKLVKYVELLKKSGKSLLQEGNKNCLFYGEAYYETVSQGLICRMISCVLWALANHIQNFNIAFSLGLLSLYIDILSGVSSIILFNRPFMGATIFYGVKNQMDGFPAEYKPAGGNIWTNGECGVKNWTGQFYGNLPSKQFYFFSSYYPGTSGFIGLRLYLNQTNIYFGYALNVNVGPNHP